MAGLFIFFSWFDKILKDVKREEDVVGEKEESDDRPQELKDIEELETKGTIQGKKPIEIIRQMNPGVFIPTGAELARMVRNGTLKKRLEKEKKKRERKSK
ncbi:MAG: hypothetical protein G01um101420_486 [Parcubacteria group bacterium Gr01-1014_20]|nr:MAG: hypothetical protein G01um101420_486 [Parcubacteria group bacterium Gr01-1014_20]